MRKRNFTTTSVYVVLLLLISGLVLSCSGSKPSQASTPTDGTAVIQQMYDRWQNKWYPNFAFEQKAIFYKDDAITKEEVWQEIYSQPGNLHIRFNGFESGNGVIFKADSVYNFQGNQLKAKQHTIHPLVLLSFDVYFYTPATTIAKLKELNFDLSKITEAKWQGRDAYVIGTTNPNDSTTSQFWVDKERLYVVRVLTNNKGVARDVEINNYKEMENYWVATEILFKTDGKLTLKEEYYNISFPKSVDMSIYNPEKFATARW
ncbi:LolA-like protein [Pontibacter fetidus]|uniref:Outer membrane lipoprotein-sorting protein n=1 Tax=Pontibacter fetidus TaxID=2700082 RepID=A0A6B2H4C1_9BACT|nr:outer membrane lipoprotein-sorting protein [Pontibacter fetidus]NDK57233.1 outer membrane lipoprotein-sorting protein [Pontibacter fetidus]